MIHRFLLVTSFCCLLFSCFEKEAMEQADIIYSNGKIYTVNEKQAWVEAVAVKDGKILLVGSMAELEAVRGDSTTVVDLEGKFVMPGIVDAHIHPMDVYIDETSGNLLFSDQLDAEGVAAAIKKFAADNPDKEWIHGKKYGLGTFPGGKLTKNWLDQVVPDRPTYIIDETGHNGGANSKALEIAGITADTPNPPLGMVDKDPATGAPTGFLSETGMGLVGRHLPKRTKEAHKEAIAKSLKQMTAWGITSFNDMMVNVEATDAYFELLEEGKLPFRTNLCLAMNEYTDQVILTAEAREYLPEFVKRSTERIRTNNFKYWADGTPLSYTSLLKEKYADKDTHGSITMTEDMRADALRFLGEGVNGHAHCITDGSVQYILDLIEEAHKKYPGKVGRFHIGHNFLIDPKDYPRYLELDVVAELGPAMWYPSPALELLKEKLGEERANQLWDFRGLMDSGIPVAWGSDWPAGTPDANALRGLEAMVTRAHPWGETEDSWGTPISVEEGLKILTKGGAYALQRENEIGSIEVGKFADMIVLDQNLLELDPADISDVKVMKTIFEGIVVYERE